MLQKKVKYLLKNMKIIKSYNSLSVSRSELNWSNTVFFTVSCAVRYLKAYIYFAPLGVNSFKSTAGEGERERCRLSWFGASSITFYWTLSTSSEAARRMFYNYLDGCQATSSPAHDQQVGMLAVGLPAEKTFTGSGHAALPGECYARFTNCRSFTRCKWRSLAPM